MLFQSLPEPTRVVASVSDHDGSVRELVEYVSGLGRRVMRFKVNGVYHQFVRSSALNDKCREYFVEHTEFAPADETIADRLVRAVVFWRIAPAQSILQNKNDSTNKPSVVDTGGGPCDKGK